MVRKRLMRIGIWVVLVLTILLWAVSLAIEAPWTPGFTIVLWAVIGIGTVLRIVRRGRRPRTPLDPFHDLNQIYQGRNQTSHMGRLSAESAEISHAFPRDSRRHQIRDGEWMSVPSPLSVP